MTYLSTRVIEHSLNKGVQLRSIRLTLIITLVLLAMYALEVSLGKDTTPTAELLLRLGGLSIHTPRIWRPITLFLHLFLHIELLHLLFNLVVCLVVGAALEPLVGAWRLAVYWLIPGALSSLMALTHQPEVIIAGASGAQSGWVGALLVTTLLKRRRLTRFRICLYCAISAPLISLSFMSQQFLMDYRDVHVEGVLIGVLCAYCDFLLNRVACLRIRLQISVLICIIVLLGAAGYLVCMPDIGRIWAEGVSAFEQKDYSMALLKFKSVSMISPGADGPYLARADIYSQLGRHDLALSEIDNLIRIRPDRTDLIEQRNAYLLIADDTLTTHTQIDRDP